MFLEVLTGCAELRALDRAAARAIGLQPTPPLEQQYNRQSWATIPVQQAEAECHNFINTAAGFGSNMYLCMKSKGYVER